jgi:hypothetical protein
VCVFLEQQPHRDGVNPVDIAPGALIELCGEMPDALQADAVHVLHRIGRRPFGVGTRVTQDSSQLHEAPRGVIHCA